MRDLDTGKVYIGPEDPKDDRSKTTLNGDKQYEGTLAATGPAFMVWVSLQDLEKTRGS